jgi:hypothetical protein
MADTQRTRAALIALFADNVTGQISAQDLRDFLVTVMEEEFAYAGDFWKQPSARKISTDRTAKGWIDYSQQIASTCSYGNIMQMDGSGAWQLASFNGNSLLVTALGVALESYTQGVSTGQILRRGIFVQSLKKDFFAGSMGKPFFLLSGTAGSMTRDGWNQSVTVCLGYPETMQSGHVSTNTVTHVFRFEPGWGIAMAQVA